MAMQTGEQTGPVKESLQTKLQTNCAAQDGTGHHKVGSSGEKWPTGRHG
jgi:hypothetical protein